MRHLSTFLTCVAVVALTSSLISAATPENAQESPKPVVPVRPQSAAEPTTAAPRATANIQLDLVVTDTRDGKTSSKSVSLLVASGEGSSSRATGRVVRPDDPIFMRAGGAVRGQPFSLNIDARANVVHEDVIRVSAAFEFDTGAESEASLVQAINVNLQNGRTLLVSKSADPVTNRTVTVELTATIREP